MSELEQFHTFAALQSGPRSDRLLINFSHRDVAPGRFSQVRALLGVQADTLFLNCEPHTWYTQGISAFGTSVEETAAGLRRFVDERGYQAVVTIGFSMGAYGAALYGNLIGAQAAAQFSGEYLLRIPGSRSAAHLRQCPLSAHEDIRPVIRHYSSSTRNLAIMGDGDPVDVLHAHLWREALGDEDRAVLTNVRHTSLTSLHKREKLIPFVDALFEGAGADHLGPLRRAFPVLTFDTDATRLASDEAVANAYAQIFQALGGPAHAMAAADIYAKSGNLEQAHRLYQGAADAARGKEKARALVRIGRILQSTEDFEGARTAFDEALALLPGDDEALLFLGNTLLQLRKPGEALQSLSLITSGKRHSAALERQGVALQKLRDIPQAIARFQQAIEINPGNNAARQRLDKLVGSSSVASG